MSTDRTILEGQTPEPPPGQGLTVRESQAATPGAVPQPTLLETQPPLTPRSAAVAFNLAPGADFLAYRLVEPIRVASGEATLWLADRKADGQRVVAKIYQYNVRPKAEIVSKLRQISKAQVIDVLESGVLEDGRHYEILEYAVHGTLADLISRGPVPEARVREVLRELADALVELHAANILHRDIKPANILVRSLEPLDLVLTDFGISSVSELSMHATSVSRTAAYSAPEAMTGVVSKASDWWSLGVIMLELLTSRQWCSGMDERQVNFQLVSRGIAVPTNLPGAWVTLLKGLLTRDHAKRWGTEQVRGWLAGRIEIAVDYETAVTALSGATTGIRHPLKLAGKEYYRVADYALSLVENWDEGVKRLARGDLMTKLLEEIEDDDLISALKDITEKQKLDANQRLSAVLLVLNPSLPLMWRQQIVSPEWLAENVDTAVSILENSALPKLLKDLRGETWLEETAKHRESLWRELRDRGVQSDRTRIGGTLFWLQIPLEQELVERLILLPAESVVAEASNLKTTYHSSTNAAVTSLLAKEALDVVEAILLLSCDRKILITHKAYEEARQNAAQKIVQAQQAVVLMKEWQADERAKIEWDEALAHLDEAAKEASTASYTAYNSSASLAKEAASLADQAVIKQKAGLKSEIEKIINEAKSRKQRILKIHGQTVPQALEESANQLTRCENDLPQIETLDGMLDTQRHAAETLERFKQFEAELRAIETILREGTIGLLPLVGSSVRLTGIQDELKRLTMNLHATQSYEDLVKLRASTTEYVASLGNFATLLGELGEAITSVKCSEEHAPRALIDAEEKFKNLRARLTQVDSLEACSRELPELKAVADVFRRVVELANGRQAEVNVVEYYNRHLKPEGWHAVPACIAINIVLWILLGTFIGVNDDRASVLFFSLLLTIPASRMIGPPLGRIMRKKALPPKY